MPGYSYHAGLPVLTTVPASLLQMLGAHVVFVSCGRDVPGHPALCMASVVQLWNAQVGVATQPKPLSTWTPIASALVQGVWYGDVTPLFQRDNGGAVLPAVCPSRLQLRYIIDRPTCLPKKPDAAAAAATSCPAPARCGLLGTPYLAAQIVSGFRVSQALICQAELGRTMEHTMRC